MLPTVPITPRYKLVMCYDIKRGMHAIYYRYVVSDFVPALNEMKIYVSAAWHTAYGEYPVRQVEYVTDSMETFHDAFATPKWQEMEERLKTFTKHYHRKIVPYRSGFQF